MEQKLIQGLDFLKDREPLCRFDKVIIGILMKVNKSGNPFVDYKDNPSNGPLPSKSIASLKKEDAGREVVLMFEEGCPEKPIIIGLVQPGERENTAVLDQVPLQEESMDVKVDGQRITITAQKEIVLKCGNASITLTRAGKILLRGTYLLSRSSGVNSIKGGSVQIN
jgi:hypothetical protein